MRFSTLGERIKTARKNKGYTQEVLAEKLDLSVQHISAIERGIKLPRLNTFVDIANELEVDANYLLRDALDHSSRIQANELYEMLEDFGEEEKRKILKMIEVLIKTSQE